MEVEKGTVPLFPIHQSLAVVETTPQMKKLGLTEINELVSTYNVLMNV